MTPLIFVTGNHRRHEEVAPLLGGRAVRQQKLGRSPAREGESLANTAARRALEAFAVLGAPCFLEQTEVELDLGPRLSGAELKRELLARGEAEVARRLGGRSGVTRVVVTYTGDGARASLFHGEIAGRFGDAPRGPEGHGWDRLWLPDGYGERTLAELGPSRFVVNMRNRPYLDLADALGPPSGVGTWEAHVTVSCPDEAAVAAFAAVCAAEGVKCVHIVLPRGATPSHPMTASFHRGERRAVLQEVHDLAARVVAAGFDVTRVKLEALGDNPDMPATDEEAARRPEGYFELHVKVLLDAGAPVEALREAAARAGGHLSRNARKVRPDGKAERFVTARLPGVGKPAALAAFDRLTRALGASARVLARTLEYTVHDSHVDLDRGWL